MNTRPVMRFLKISLFKIKRSSRLVIRFLFGLPKKELFALFGIGLFLVLGLGLLWFSSLELPTIDSFEDRKVEQSTKIYDRTGEILLYDIHKDIKRTVIAYEDISRNIKNATVAIEDSEFYEHKGIRFISIMRAILANVLSLGYSQGGSTITQQVVKNSLLTQEKTIARKIKEWALSLKLEQVMTKEEILSLYLNESPYGGSVYGIEEASQTFFGKSAKDVTLLEAAYLAALPNAPTYYSPYGQNTEKLEQRKNLVLQKMKEKKFISEEEFNNAMNEKVVFKPQEKTGIKAPHFVEYVKQELVSKYGESSLEENGWRIITTLDYDLQSKMEEVVTNYAEKNKADFSASNAAVVSTDPKNGDILVMIGSKDYFSKEIDGNFNVATAMRQPGSAFKPFVYATAFEKGYRPETVLFDLPTEFSAQCSVDGQKLGANSVCYTPENYDNKYRGPVTLREGLAQSINVPSVKALYLAGIKNSIQTAKRMGITGLSTPDRYGLTLVLGGGEVSLVDLASSYGTFATEGLATKHRSILRIEDKDGKVVWEDKGSAPERVLSEQTARQINNILSDDSARAPAFGVHSKMYFADRQVAIKTGTTNDYRDVWAIGYTPSITVGAWAGNNDNTPMIKKVAGYIIVPMWHDLMNVALEKTPKEFFSMPDKQSENVPPAIKGLWQGGIPYEVDTVSGGLATEFTPEETRETKVVRQVRSILHWINKDDPLGETPPDREDAQYERWQYAVDRWAKTNNLFDESIEVIPDFYDNVHTETDKPILKITSPANNQSFERSSSMFLNISITSRQSISKAEVFINGEYVGSAITGRLNIDLSNVSSLREENSLSVIVTDKVQNRVMEEISFNTY